VDNNLPGILQIKKHDNLYRVFWRILIQIERKGYYSSSAKGNSRRRTLKKQTKSSFAAKEISLLPDI
jgi:hypothetical protein